ncbi:MAG TPA: hypothetical protein VI112_11015 [Bacteroidia bacterium]|jgi:hypothetical protein
MTSIELEKKIRSFSEHNGLGKKYHHYEIVSTGNEHFQSQLSGDTLPSTVKILIRPERKAELLFLVIFSSIMLLIMAGAMKNGFSPWMAGMIICSWASGSLIGWMNVNRGERKKIIELNIGEKGISVNKDRFSYLQIENTVLKKDLDSRNKLVALWLLVVLQNGDIYYYEIPKRYAYLKIKGKFRLDELLYNYRENQKLESKKINSPFA